MKRKRQSLLIEKIPADLKIKFKVACAKRDRSMKDVIIDLMKEFVERRPLR